MSALVLDRVEIEDAGANATRLAEAIHHQLTPRPGPIPIHQIAKALDIVEIREERLDDFEAALITLPQRSYGSILLNLNSSPQRRRYSLGHELLHFLNPWHEPTSPDGFHCSRQDMRETKALPTDRHRRQEAEANEFAVEVLAPPARLKPHLEQPANLEHALAVAKDLDISREAAVRRYVALHDECLAVLFVADGKLRYADTGAEFPRLSVSRASPIPALPKALGARTLSGLEEVDAGDWVQRPEGACLYAQVLRQREGHAIVLLKAVMADADDEDPEDTYERFTHPGF